MSPLAKGVARVLFFPWGFAALVSWPFRRVRRPFRQSPLRRAGLEIVHLFAQLAVTLPASMIVLVELALVLNARVIEELPDRSLPALDLSGAVLALPPYPRSIGAVVSSDLVHRFAPVVVQVLGDRPRWDIPVAIDFDGNDDPRDNPSRSMRLDRLEPVVYGELTAVTSDSYYLTYSLYHLRDYDHPLRERLSRWSHHDNDNEGLHLRVARDSERVEEVETWFHNRFLYCDRDGQADGSEPVSALIQFEGERPVVLSQSHGHGVRCAVPADSGVLERALVLRPSPTDVGERVQAAGARGTAALYRLADFDRWYEHASLGTPRGAPMFVGSMPIALGDSLPGYIAGADRPVGHWSRPKPMWAWDDAWDGVPGWVWHLLPSVSFEARGGTSLSHEYQTNRPVRALLGRTAADLLPMSRPRHVEARPESKWEEIDGGEGYLERRSAAALLLLRAYLNRVFAHLG